MAAGIAHVWTAAISLKHGRLTITRRDEPDLGDGSAAARHQASTPDLLVNRQGLSAIAYRVGPTRRFAKVSRASVRRTLAGVAGPANAVTMISPSRCSTPGPSPATSSRLPRAYCQREAYLRTATDDFRFGAVAPTRISTWSRSGCVHIWPSHAGRQSRPARRQATLPITLAVGTRCEQFPGRMSNRKPSRRLNIEARPAWNALLARTATQP